MVAGCWIGGKILPSLRSVLPVMTLAFAALAVSHTDLYFTAPQKTAIATNTITSTVSVTTTLIVSVWWYSIDRRPTTAEIVRERKQHSLLECCLAK